MKICQVVLRICAEVPLGEILQCYYTASIFLCLNKRPNLERRAEIYNAANRSNSLCSIYLLNFYLF
jgi:hypothetical protein